MPESTTSDISAVELSQLALPEFRQFQVTSRFTRSATRHFNHCTFIHGHLCSVFGHPLPGLRKNEPVPDWIVIPNVAESGHIYYDEGDSYNFGITAIGREAPPAESLRATFSKNLVCPMPAIRDSALRFDTLQEIQVTSLDEQMAAIESCERLTIHFTSPLLIEQRIPGRNSRIFSPEYFDVPHFFKTLYARLYDLAKLDCESDAPYSPPAAPKVRLTKNHLLWLNIPHPGGGAFAPEYHGAIGKVTLEGKFGAWLRPLVAGQYLHLGKRTAFGFGRYRIEELAEVKFDEITAAKPLIVSVIDSQNLEQALQHIQAGGDQCTSDIDEGASDPESLTRSLRDQVAVGSYKAGTLHGAIIKKPDGSNRYLAIPSLPDRVLQRATAQVLAPILDKLFEDSSFAYRSGRSRLQAADQLDRWRRDGFDYVVKADIESFFDLIDWELLFDKLDALLPSEPLIEMIRTWVRLDVRFGNQLIKRKQGIPQGSPISPLLANLYLDEFDEAVAAKGFRLARYADDFVILCPSKERAEQALQAARESLRSLKLELNKGKTEITDFDHGFRYLGYLFLKSMIIDVHSMPPDDATGGGHEQLSKVVATHGWLQQIAESTNEIPLLPSVAAIDSDEAEDAEAQTPKSVLYLDSPELRVSIENKVLVAKDLDTGEEREFPLAKLSHLVVRQGPHVTLPTVLTALESQVPVFFTRTTGSLRAALTLEPADWRLWQFQAEARNDVEFCLRFAKEIVSAKLTNQAVLLRDRKEDDTLAAVHRIAALEQTCERADSIEAARGYEGAGAREYWEEFGRLFGAQWKFTGRVKHPPTDPVNALLSFGYTLLYCHCSTALQLAGLNPTLSLFHEPRGNFHALAADLQEEFRHLVDSVVLRLLRKGEIHLEDFETSHHGEGTRLTQQARRRFVAAIEDRLLTLFTPPGGGRRQSYRDFIAAQAEAIAAVVRDRNLVYRALRIR